MCWLWWPSSMSVKLMDLNRLMEHLVKVPNNVIYYSVEISPKRSVEIHCLSHMQLSLDKTVENALWGIMLHWQGFGELAKWFCKAFPVLFDIIFGKSVIKTEQKKLFMDLSLCKISLKNVLAFFSASILLVLASFLYTPLKSLLSVLKSIFLIWKYFYSK